MSMQEDSVSYLSITLLISVFIFSHRERSSSTVHPAVGGKQTSFLFVYFMFGFNA